MPSNNDMKFALESIVLGWNIIKNHHASRPKSTGLSDWEQIRLEIAEHALLDTQTFPALDESEYKYQLRELVDSIAPYGDTGTAYFSAEILEASIAMLEEKPTTKYVHQFLTSNGEWDTVVNDDGTPSTFDTQAEADADMEVFHSFATGAVSRGDMDDHNRADWRVAELEG